LTAQGSEDSQTQPQSGPDGQSELPSHRLHYKKYFFSICQNKYLPVNGASKSGAGSLLHPIDIAYDHGVIQTLYFPKYSLGVT
jgi:hypothetical protein